MTGARSTPLPESPFVVVRDDYGRAWVYCCQCHTHKLYHDILAMQLIASRRFGRVFLVLQAPWVAQGLLRYVKAHGRCLMRYQEERNW